MRSHDLHSNKETQRRQSVSKLSQCLYSTPTIIWRKGYILQSDGEAVTLWVVEVCHKVGSMFSVLSEEIFSLLTGEIVKHIPREHREGGRKGKEREEGRWKPLLATSYIKGCKMHAPTCARSVDLELPPYHAASASLSVCPFGVLRLGRFCRDTSATVLPDRVFPAGTCVVQERRYTISHRSLLETH